jgi:hypothetical protein
LQFVSLALIMFISVCMAFSRTWAS